MSEVYKDDDEHNSAIRISAIHNEGNQDEYIKEYTDAYEYDEE